MEKLMIKPTKSFSDLIKWWVLDREQCSAMKKKKSNTEMCFISEKTCYKTYILYQQKGQFTDKFQIAVAQRVLLLLLGISPSCTLSLVYLPSD